MFYGCIYSEIEYWPEIVQKKKICLKWTYWIIQLDNLAGALVILLVDIKPCTFKLSLDSITLVLLSNIPTVQYSSLYCCKRQCTKIFTNSRTKFQSMPTIHKTSVTVCKT